jgi:lipid II:glycine glycyltransferase (peptidoglycan interpeptide bridge formation enzyme)
MRLITTRDEWNAALLRLPRPHVLQSWEWGAFKERHGWRATRLLLEADGRPRAAASVLRRRAAPLPLSILYVPKGPTFDHGDLDALATALAELEQLARRERAIFVKIDPDVPSENQMVQRLLRDRGWRPSAEQIQFRNTLLSDLTLSEEELLAGMKSKTRYNVRLAARRGVTVRPGTRADLPLFYQMYAETAVRDGFIIRPYEYYEDAWGSFMDAGQAQMLLAYFDEPLAGVIIFRFGPTAWYFYGASRGRHRNLMPNHLLQWEAMRWAKAQGCTIYDWWGAPDVLDESDPMWGVYRFKEGFGGRFVEGIGAWDFPVSRVLYWLYTALMPRYLNWLRKRHRKQKP